MIKVSELLSKRLICLSTAEMIGTISNIVFDSKLSKGLILKIYNDEGDDVSISYVELKKVSSFDEDACTVKDKSHIMFEWNAALPPFNNPINFECYNQDGKFLGLVKDVALEQNKVVSITVGEVDFKPSELLSYSERLLIINDTQKPYKLPKTKIKVPKSDVQNRKITVHSLGNESAVAKVFDLVEPVVKESADVALPQKMPPLGQVTPNRTESSYSPYSFLIGKIVAKDILSENGSVLIEDRSVIDAAVILAAKKAGKLVQLALHAE